MDLLQRFPLLLTSPDYATADLREYPPLRDGFTLVTIYALISSLAALIDGIVSVGSIGFAIMIFFQSLLGVYLSWVIVAGFFHLIALRWGGSAEFLYVLGGIGLASAPQILFSIVAFLTNIAEWTFLSQDPNNILPLARLVLDLLGSAWGWPGLLCYYVLKNIELMAPSRAALLAAAGFLLLAAFELYSYNPF
jgi:hypothetical protein